jgi:hypothetical protein
MGKRAVADVVQQRGRSGRRTILFLDRKSLA